MQDARQAPSDDPRLSSVPTMRDVEFLMPLHHRVSRLFSDPHCQRRPRLNYPWWLNEFVTELFDLLSPMGEALKQSGAEIPKPGASGWSEACADHLRIRTDRW